MDFIWGIIYNLQLITNQSRFERVKLPAPIDLLYSQIDHLVNFNLSKVPQVKDFVAEFMSSLKETIDNIGIIPLGCIVIVAMVLLLQMLIRLTERFQKLRNILISVRQQLMWSIVLRATLTAYLDKFLDSFDQLYNGNKKSDISQVEVDIQESLRRSLKEIDDIPKQDSAFHADTAISSLKVLFLCIFPLVVIMFLRSNRRILTDENVKKRYGSLYHRQRVGSRFIDPIWTTPIFLGRRIIIACVTIVFQFMPVI